MLFYCAPVYVAGYLSLLLFAPPFGLVQLPYFFDPHSYAPPLEDPWDFLRSMLLPWLVVGAPLGGGDPAPDAGADARHAGRGLRAHGARRRGVPHAMVVRRHAGPPTYVSVASLFGASAPLMVTNMVLVEYVFTRPGLLPAHEARARPGARLAAPSPAHRHPDAAGARAVGGGADRPALTARRPGDRLARPEDPRPRARRSARPPRRAAAAGAGARAPRRSGSPRRRRARRAARPGRRARPAPGPRARPGSAAAARSPSRAAGG